MAVTIRGQAILQFGTSTITGFDVVVTGRERENEVESYQLQDEQGKVITDITGDATGGDMAYKTTNRYNFIPFSGETEVTPGAVFTGAAGEKGIVRRARRIEQQKMPVMWALDCESFPGVTLA